MNHQKIYDRLILQAKTLNRSRSDNAYYENHHIIPRCLNGNNEDDNLVLLTAREHFIAHKLLTYIHKNNFKIIHAFHLMTCMNKRKYEITSRDYAYAIELFRSIPIDHKGDKNTMYGKKHKTESIEKNKKSQPYNSENFPTWLKTILREKSLGEKNGMFGKSLYDVWCINYGKDIADQKLFQYKNNLIGKIWVRHNILHQSKQIKKEEIELYFSQGWEKGRFKQPNRKNI